MEKLNFSLDLQTFKENEGSGEFEGILVNYNHDRLAHGVYKFAKGSMKMNEGKTLYILYNHVSGNVPVGTMTGVEKEDGFHIKAKLSLEKDEGGYINKMAAQLYNLMKSGAQFELSTGGWITEYSEKKEDDKRFYEITKFDAYEGSITPRGAVAGSKITKVFNENMEDNTMDEKRFEEMLAKFAKEMKGANSDEQITGLVGKFAKLEEGFNEIKENSTLTKEFKDGIETKFNEFNDIIKGLKSNFTATKEEITAAEEFAAFMQVTKNNTGTQTFKATEEIKFAAADPATSITHEKGIKPTYMTKILERIQAMNPILADINFMSITDGSLYIPREMMGLPATGWIGETDERVATAANTIDNVTINLYQMYAMPVVSNRLLATNFVGYANFLLKRLEYAMSLQLANTVLNGTGVGQPKGILKETIPSHEIDTTDDSTFADSIIDAYYSTRDEIASTSKWIMRRSTWARIAKLKNTQKDFYITDLNRGTERTLMTRPVVIVEDDNSGLKDFATAAAGTDPIILFANLGMAMQGIQNTTMDMNIKDQITSKGLTKFYVEKMFGAGTQLPEYATKIVKKA